MKVKVCNCHEEIVPLVWTFAFPGSEYWCPACGYTSGMFGAGKIREITFSEARKAIEWRKKGAEYLEARSKLNADKVLHEGEWIDPRDLPEEIQNHYRSVVASWEYELSK